MSIDFISVPYSIGVPRDWFKTPDLDEAKVNQVAQAYFADWADASLGNLNFVLNIGKVTMLIGVGVSIYLMSIPSIILCGAALTFCFIGSNAIWRENVTRSRNVCLELENWFIEFKEACENLKEKIEPFVADPKNDDIDLDNLKELLNEFDKFPVNNLQNLVKKLEESHH